METEKLKTAALPGQQVLESDERVEGLALGELLGVLLEHRWLIATLSLAFLAMGAAYSFVAKPIYRADGLIQVEEQGVGGVSSMLKDLAPMLSDSTTVAAEQEILSSRMVLGRVVNKLKLDIEASPRFFPLIGEALYRRQEQGSLVDPLFGLSSFAWGGEVIKVDALEVPKYFLDKKIKLVVDKSDGFTLYDLDGMELLSGKVGERASNKKYSIFVSKIHANEGASFSLTKWSQEKAIKRLRDNFLVKERGKKSGVLEVSLTGGDFDKTVVILDDVMNTYVRQNIDLRSAEAEKTLKFLETQLPVLKREMDAAEAAYNNYRQAKGSLDITIETQSVLQSLVDVDNQIVALKQERDELRQSFTAEHPRVQAVDQRLERLRERRKEFDADVNKLPDTQKKILQLARDVEVSTTLYTNLVNTSQQLKISKAGTVGDVRIVDAAAAEIEPIGLKTPVVLAIFLTVGFFVSLAVVWVKRSLRVVVEDPETIEAKLGVPVYATIPHSKDEVEIVKRAKTRKSNELLAVANPGDDAVESLRGLRTTIHFALMDAGHNSILITGSSPGLGKSFISKNLGAVLAQSGKRIAIIDADLRKGHINKEFGLSRDIGVSEYVSGNVTLEEIIKPTSVPNLWVVTTGQIPPNPSELLMHLRFEGMLEKLGQQFDTLIIDAPPILAVSDAAIIGRIAGATLMVARAGRHPIGELEQAIKRMNNSGVSVRGFVFNDLDTDRQRYRYGYSGYVYRYEYKTK